MGGRIGKQLTSTARIRFRPTMHPNNGFGTVWATGDGAVGGKFMPDVGGAGGVGVAGGYVSNLLLG